MIKTYTIKEGQKLTEEQLKEIEEAKKKPIVFDEECFSFLKNKEYVCRKLDKNETTKDILEVVV